MGDCIKFLISIGCFAGDCVRRGIRSICGIPLPSFYVILYYHSVRDSERARFADQMRLLRRVATPVGTGDDIASVPGVRYCAVTFDDVFENVLSNALPELSGQGIPATIFVTSGTMGRNASWWPGAESRERLISAAQLRGLPNSVEIGSHTVSHPLLSRLSECAARSELTSSRRDLENVIGRPVTVFSFPYGDVTEELIGWCREAGYRRVFTSLPFLAPFDQTTYVVGRVAVDPSESLFVFRLKLMGAYRWLPYAIALKKRMVGMTATK